MLPLSLWLYKAQRGLLFSQHLHVLMLIDVTFLNGVPAPWSVSQTAIKDFYLFICAITAREYSQTQIRAR